MSERGIPAYPDEKCKGCDHFCLDAMTEPPDESCWGKQSPEMIAAYLSLKGLMPRPLIMPDDEKKAESQS